MPCLSGSASKHTKALLCRNPLSVNKHKTRRNSQVQGCGFRVSGVGTLMVFRVCDKPNFLQGVDEIRPQAFGQRKTCARSCAAGGGPEGLLSVGVRFRSLCFVIGSGA